MARRKETAMKYWGFYCDEELKRKAKQIAENLNESDSEYIRKAIEQRNEFITHEKEKQNRDYIHDKCKEIVKSDKGMTKTFFKG